MKIKMLVLAAIGAAVALTFASPKDNPLDESSMMNVSTGQAKIDMARVPGSTDNLSIFVDKNSIQEFPYEDITLRSATFAYHLNTPLEARGHKIHYVYKEAAYHCDSGNYVETLFIFYGEDADKPLFYSDGDGEVSKVSESQNGLAEFTYVCTFKTPAKKKTPPKSETPLSSRRLKRLTFKEKYLVKSQARKQIAFQFR